MENLLVKNYVHIVFSTRHRVPMILPDYENELHSYLGDICKKLECQPVIVGGYTDHIHILCTLSKKITMVKLIAELKSNSSAWMKAKDETLKTFRWQDGCGLFSVNPSDLDVVIAYIANQKEHHSKNKFKDEYSQFLKSYKIEYDEAYVWD